MVFLFSGSVV